MLKWEKLMRMLSMHVRNLGYGQGAHQFLTRAISSLIRS
jgi:hypothetical protein